MDSKKEVCYFMKVNSLKFYMGVLKENWSSLSLGGAATAVT
jgi:hypothetical protein